MAWVVAVSYGLAPGFGALIGFDFHEVALAVPLLAFSMAAMLRSDHRAAVLWALPLVLVKEDLGLTVAALGVVVFLRGSRRWGIFAMVFGAVSFLLIALWLLPATQGTGGFADAVRPRRSRGRAADPGRRCRHTSCARCCSCSSRPASWRCARRCCCSSRCPPSAGGSSPTGYTYWDPWYQYDAVLVPIAVAAMIEGARLLSAPLRRLGLALPLVGTLALVPQQAFAQVWDRDFWRTPDRTAAVDRALAKIPTGSRVAASDTLGARIALRTELYLIGDTSASTGRHCPPRSSTTWSGWPSTPRSLPAQVPAWKGFARLLDTGDFRWWRRAAESSWPSGRSD